METFATLISLFVFKWKSNGEVFPKNNAEKLFSIKIYSECRKIDQLLELHSDDL